MSRERAESLLQHYFRTVWHAAGLQWDADNDAEVGSIVDALCDEIDGAVRTHSKNEPHIYPNDGGAAK